MTYFTWLLLAIAVAVIGLVVRRFREKAGMAIAVLGSASAVAVIGWQAYTLVSGGTVGPAVDRHSAVVAYFMGYEVLGDLKARSGTIALVLPPDTRSNQEQLDSLFNAFARVVSPRPEFDLVDVSVEASEAAIRRREVTIEDFARAIGSVTNMIACVSFVGFPAEFETMPAGRVGKPVPLYLYDPSGGSAWKEELSAGRIRRVIVPRPRDAGGADADDLAGPPGELFQRFFLLATPANAESIASQLGEYE